MYIQSHVSTADLCVSVFFMPLALQEKLFCTNVRLISLVHRQAIRQPSRVIQIVNSTTPLVRLERIADDHNILYHAMLTMSVAK